MVNYLPILYVTQFLPTSPQWPKSGTVRPLSGRVFMRRTSEKGWVAKAYPHQPSQTDLDIFDDLSADSFDSFFDDDFDTAHQEDKLQNLLNVNTLGVESRVRWDRRLGYSAYDCHMIVVIVV